MNRSLTIKTGQCHVHRYMQPLLQRIMDGEIDPTYIITHRLSGINLADRVVLLDGGRIVAQGAHEELLVTEPLYAEVLAHGDQGTPDTEDD